MDDLITPHPLSRPVRTSTTIETVRRGLELRLGSNIFRNTNGVVTVHGREQLVLEASPTQEQLLMTLDVYAEDGTRIAHLRRNILMVDRTKRFRVETHQAHQDGTAGTPWVRLSDQASGDIVLEAHLISENKILISSGKLYSHTGQLMEITPHYCRVAPTMKLFGEIREARGGSVILG